MDDLDIIWLNGGRGFMGTDAPVILPDGEGPYRKTRIKDFGLTQTTITNAQFAKFIAATGYETHAEEFGWSFIFYALWHGKPAPTPEGLPWWQGVEGTTWACPLGPGSDWQDAPDHPAVHISHRDADAYAKWAGGRLPTEAEWEYAARGGQGDIRYPWGDDEPDDTSFMPSNIWQGKFPDTNTEADGFLGTAPAKSFEPNSFGFYNMCGNVWEWTADLYRVKSLTKQAKERNARARKMRDMVSKGGSYLCHNSYCWRYRIAARSGLSWDSSAGHHGFRVAFDPK